MVALMEWGDRYLNDGQGPVALRERGTGDAVHLELRTGARPVEPNEIVPTLNA